MSAKRNATSFVVQRIETPGKPGAVCFSKRDPGKIVGFSHACPCGCGKWSFVRLNPENWAPGTAPIWTRTGDDEHMTLAPSIGILPMEGGAYHWHGYLREGVFEEC